MHVHRVDQLLEQDEVARHGPDPCTNQDAVDMPSLEFNGDDLLRGLTKIRQAILRIIAESFHPFCGGVYSRQHLRSRRAWERCKVRRREIEEFGV